MSTADTDLIFIDELANRMGVGVGRQVDRVLHVLTDDNTLGPFMVEKRTGTANQDVAIELKNSDGNIALLTHKGDETIEIENSNGDKFIMSNAGALTIPGIIKPDASDGADSANGLIIGVGTTADPALNATANKHFVEIYCKQNATSGDNRGIYLRTEFSNTGGGDGLRVNTVLSGQAGTVNGTHLGLEVEAGGTLSGLGNASRSTLMFANEAGPGGTICASMHELWAGGASTDISSSLVSVFRVVMGGDATGIGNMDDNAYFIDFAGMTAGTGNFIDTNITAVTGYGSLRVRIPGVGTRYIPITTGS